ncbi:hypothetical protein E2C01_049465 [Portunus trituberculatus]|uniref:Uncharacterized protein n=1 Tax=Portunus trituberculatus TaxID=210409 RepID=A0A5B7GDS8_PORTR|nr:hypothetical protein [Portunus trituberculatus]
MDLISRMVGFPLSEAMLHYHYTNLMPHNIHAQLPAAYYSLSMAEYLRVIIGTVPAMCPLGWRCGIVSIHAFGPAREMWDTGPLAMQPVPTSLSTTHAGMPLH